jgi:molecular chaperone DnaK
VPPEAPKLEPDPAPAPQAAVEVLEPALEPEPAPEPEPTPEPAPVEDAKERLRALLAAPIRASPPEVVLGIDLGTCWARVAVFREGKAQLIPFGERSGLSTLVAVDDTGHLLVGEAARARAEHSPRSATSGLHRLLGLRLLSPQLRALDGLLPFPVIAGPQGEACAELRGRPVSPVESTTLLLRELKAAASHSLGYEAHRAVLCVPAFFNARQRAAVRQAGAQAGLTVLRVLNAPSAAALAFGHGRGLARKRVLVVDVGGGSLEVSVVQLTGDDLEVITTGGDPTLGGMDFDARLAEALVSELSQLGKPRPEHLLDWGPVRAAAEAAKVALSEHEQTPFPLAATPAPEPLTRERLEALTADLVQRLTLTVRQVLESCALSPQGLDAVLLVGGQGCAPLVRRRLEESLGVPVAAGVEPLGSAALGAALLGQGLLDFESGKPGVTVAEVLPLPLGVAERTGSVRRVLERNTPLPASKTLGIPLGAPGPLALAFFQGDAPAAMDHELLGTLELEVERPGEAEVHFDLSADGALGLSVTLPGSRRQEVELASAYLEDSALEAMIARSPLAGEPETRPGGGLLSGLRKLFGRR